MFPTVNSRQSFPELEKTILASWKANNTFKRSLEIREGAPEFNFYDGPPFATGTPHYGHLLAGTIKDVIPRYQTMQGKFVERRFGWDCHGLPIENIVEKKMGISGKKDIEDKVGVFEFNEQCRANVFQYVDDWRQTVDRMGRWVDMDDDYKTMDADFMESVWWVFKNIYDKGYVYESYRVVPYCPRCSTPLSNFEVNQGYEDKQDKAVTVKFSLVGSGAGYDSKEGGQFEYTEDGYLRYVLAVVRDAQGRVLMLKNKKHGDKWQFAGGKIDAGESPTEALAREVMEELGVKATVGGLLGTNRVFAKGTLWQGEYYEVTLEGTPTIQEPHKHIDMQWIDVQSSEENAFGYVMQCKGETIEDAAILSEIFDASAYHKIMAGKPLCHSISVLAWTTTPWTLPANLGLAVGADLQYAEILDKATGDTYILAKDRVATYYKNPTDYILLHEYAGSTLVGLKYEPIFPGIDAENTFLGVSNLLERKHKIASAYFDEMSYHIVTGHHVTAESGTGVVHIAPAYGEDDFQIGKREHLGFFSHIDEVGNTCNLPNEKDNGIYVFDFNQIVIDRLKAEKKLIHIGTIDHSYPHCYRCHTPLIYRAISAWYVNVESMKDKMIANNQKVNWMPDNIKDGRFGKWVEGARDWNISRNRYWGSAIPVWKSEDGDIIVIGSVKELYEGNKAFGDIIEKDGKYTYKDGRDIDLHKHFVDQIKLQKDGKTYTRIPEVLDCWFESGAMPYASKHYPFEGTENFKFPADFIAEGLDQTRGWFYTLLILGTALFDNTPFMNVIVNGLILAEDGKKMSKSLKNYPDPMGLIEKHGADALRFYMLSSPVVKADDLRFSEAGVEEVVKKVLLPLWNTYSFFTTYANIDGWTPSGTRITLMRHGQTDANIGLRISDAGETSPLNAVGREQARKAGAQMKQDGKDFDVIIVSPAVRAKETAEIVAKEIGFSGEIITVHEIIERHAGECSGMSHAEVEAWYKEKTGKDMNGPHHYQAAYEHGNGEQEDVHQARIEVAINDMIAKYPGKRILVVAHGGTFRGFNTHFFNLTMEQGYRGAARIGNAEYRDFLSLPLTNNLDTWIISRLNRLVATVAGGFEAYDLQIPTRAITEFMDDLTNWYVRRSRRRFWKSENDGDKFEAYETLYHVLVTLTKVMAPITPMIADAVYCGLTCNESVHLTRFPEGTRAHMFDGLEADMKRARDIITLGLALRGQKKIRVRQPLASITIGEPIDAYFQEIIREELNVKEVKTEDMSHVARTICKPNAKLIGPRFGKAVQDIIVQAKSGNFIELDAGRIQIGEYILESGEYEIAYEPLEGVSLDVMSGTGMVIAMDTVMTEELELEGYARDLVRVIQDLRKEAGYEVSDRVRVALHGEKMEKILSLFADYITSETLSVIDESLTTGDISREIDVEGIMVKVVVKR